MPVMQSKNKKIRYEDIDNIIIKLKKYCHAHSIKNKSCVECVFAQTQSAMCIFLEKISKEETQKKLVQSITTFIKEEL